jgi:hypothetical protein
MVVDESEYQQIDPALYTQFKTKEISDCVSEYFKKKSQTLFIPSTELVRRHIKSLDSQMQSVVLKQEHNCFTIIIDGAKCFVWGSTPTDTKDYAETHGAFLIKSYQDINK